MTRVPGDHTACRELLIRTAAPNEIKIKHKMSERGGGDRRPTDNRHGGAE